ncbi:MAG: bacteriocin [Firmicutes bacterium]|nr:bacteriocin [Candidatus Colivicinus equi]
MAKTKEELSQIKKEFETLTTKLKELSEDELKMITGGEHGGIKPGGSHVLLEAEEFALEETHTM